MKDALEPRASRFLRSQQLIDFVDDLAAFGKRGDLDAEREEIQGQAGLGQDAVDARRQHAGVDAGAQHGRHDGDDHGQRPD